MRVLQTYSKVENREKSKLCEENIKYERLFIQKEEEKRKKNKINGTFESTLGERCKQRYVHPMLILMLAMLPMVFCILISEPTRPGPFQGSSPHWAYLAGPGPQIQHACGPIRAWVDSAWISLGPGYFTSQAGWPRAGLGHLPCLCAVVLLSVGVQCLAAHWLGTTQYSTSHSIPSGLMTRRWSVCIHSRESLAS